MKRALGANFVVIAIAVIGCQQRGDNVAADEKMPGIHLVGSSVKDPLAIGGFSPCDNYPREFEGHDWGKPGTIAVVAFPGEPLEYFDQPGFAVRVINRSSEGVWFAACDSTLHLLREAQDSWGTWREIEVLPKSFCGNSYHRVFLGPGQFWEFPARVYDGSTKTKMRFRLDPGEPRSVIYSNEFEGCVVGERDKTR